MNLKNLKRVYFIGIGGIGMSALARYFKFLGKEVHGYDRTSTLLTEELVQEGMVIQYDASPQHITKAYHQGNSETLVVYTPAIPTDHPLMTFFKEGEHNLYKRSAVLGLITKESKTVAIAGTHGKTTTSSILAHTLHSNGHGCNAFLGGITVNYESNFLFSGEHAMTVVEADEFDRSFLTLNPYLSVITSMDADHLDVYGNVEEFEEGFRLFAQKNAVEGVVFFHDSLPQVHTRSKQQRYGHQDSSFASVMNERDEYGAYLNFIIGDVRIEKIRFQMPGEHNASNALAAACVCLELGLTKSEIKQGLESFKGIKRRFEIHINREDLVYIDDYAHHPTEITATIKAVKHHYPKRKVTGVFQPHLFTRTKDFADEFAKSLEVLDEIILLEIYPAREKPIEGIDSQWLLDKISNPQKKRVNKERLLQNMDVESLDVLLTLGAGDIDTLVQPLINKLKDNAVKA